MFEKACATMGVSLSCLHDRHFVNLFGSNTLK